MCTIQKHNRPWTDAEADPNKWTMIPADRFTEFTEYQCVGCGHVMTLSDNSKSDREWIKKFDLNRQREID